MQVSDVIKYDGGHNGSLPVHAEGNFARDGQNIVFSGTGRPQVWRGLSRSRQQTIGAATNATPIVLTTVKPHNYKTGDSIVVIGVLGNTAANGTWTITVVSTTTFSLNTSVGNGAYTSGGIAYPSYAGPTVAYSVPPIGSELLTGFVGLGSKASAGAGSAFFYLAALGFIGKGKLSRNGVTLRISVTDGVTTIGNAVITSATGRWTVHDVGSSISGTGIPVSTTILSYQSPTQVTMSQNATANGVAIIFTWDVLASTALRFLLLVGDSFISSTSGPFEFGLDPPLTVTIAEITVGNNTSLQAQSYSLKITEIRSTTGGESNASPASISLTVSATARAIVVTFPPISVNTGADRYGMFGTQAKFGPTGPHYRINRIVKNSSLSGTNTNTNASMTAGSPIVTVTAGGGTIFTQDDIGKYIEVPAALIGPVTLKSFIRSVATDGLTATLADNCTLNAAAQTATWKADFTAHPSGTAAMTRSLAFEWADADLLTQRDLAPVTNNKPPRGSFGAVLQNMGLVFNCYGSDTVDLTPISAGTSGATMDKPGTIMACSKQGYPEAFPADSRFLVAQPEAFTAVLSHPSNGTLWAAGRNTLSRVRYNENQQFTADGRALTPPVFLDVVWPDVGFRYPYNFCAAENGLVGFVEGRGMVMLGPDGEPDFEFARPVSEFIRQWSALYTCVGYDPATQTAYWLNPVNTNASKFGFSYDRVTGLWSVALNYQSSGMTNFTNGVPIWSFTLDNTLQFIFDDTAKGPEHTILQIAQGNRSEGPTYSLFSSWRHFGFPEKQKNIDTISPSAFDSSNPGSVVVSVYKDYDDATVRKTRTFTTTGTKPVHLPTIRAKIRQAKSIAVKYAGSLPEGEIVDTDVPGETYLAGVLSGIRR